MTAMSSILEFAAQKEQAQSLVSNGKEKTPSRRNSGLARDVRWKGTTKQGARRRADFYVEDRSNEFRDRTCRERDARWPGTRGSSYSK